LPEKGEVRKKRKEKKREIPRKVVCRHKKGDVRKKRKEKKKTKADEKVAPAKARFRVPYTKNSFFGSRVLGLRSSPSWLKYRLLRDLV
jgi:hypothetical protein